MKKTLLTTLIGMALLGAPLLSAQPPEHQPIRIMIGQEGGADHSAGMQFVSAAVSSSLAKYCGNACVVVEPSESDDTREVDAYLRGNVGTIKSCWDCSPYIQGEMRLVANDGTVLWSDTVRSNRFARNTVSSFADNVAKKLVSHLTEKLQPAAASK